MVSTGGVVATGGLVAAGGVDRTPPAISGAGTFFSGADMTVTKLVAGDAIPGYYYVSANAPKGIMSKQ